MVNNKKAYETSFRLMRHRWAEIEDIKYTIGYLV